ncbi:hypothetical protein WN48_04752 [Eufriesea mexicana]|nr:hypothetical protein WN48_04752 [Eufriesea mexicana]
MDIIHLSCSKAISAIVFTNILCAMCDFDIDKIRLCGDTNLISFSGTYNNEQAIGTISPPTTLYFAITSLNY